MATLTEIATQRGDIVTSVCAVRYEPPLFEKGNPTIRSGIPLDTPRAKLRVTVYEVERVNTDPQSGVNTLTVRATTESKKPGKRTDIPTRYRNYLSGPGERVDQELRAANARVIVRQVDDETRLIVSPNSKVDNPDGRRMYIHQDAFAGLASQSPELADLIFKSLMRVSAIKTAHHHLADAVNFGTITKEQGEQVLHSLEAEAKEYLTTMMRQIGYRSPDDERDFFPILEADEHIEASCFEDGYFTYATGVKSGRKMFDDKEKLKEERIALREGRGPKDLTIISRNIAQIDAQRGFGLDTADKYFSSGKTDRLTPDEMESIKNAVRDEVLTDTAKTVLGSIEWDMENDDQRTVLRGLLSACVSSLKSGIFRDSAESDDPAKRFAERRSTAENLIVSFQN